MTMRMCRFAEVSSANPAKLLNVYPQKGRVAVGSDAGSVVRDGECGPGVSSVV